MSSALACIGLAVSDDAEFDLLVKDALLVLREVGTFGGVYVGRWQDDSGTALVLGLHDGQLADFTFAYAGSSGGLLADCRLLHEAIAFAKVAGADGRQLTAMAFEAEQYRQLAACGQPVSGPARITALGIDAAIYPDAEAFAASPASQVHPSPGTAPPPPPNYDRCWPPRLGAESFISHAAFPARPQYQSRARLSSTVLNATRRVSGLTGQSFTVAAVRTAGFEASLSWPPATTRTCPTPATSSAAPSSCPPPSTPPT
jgi:hypothetical protein